MVLGIISPTSKSTGTVMAIEIKGRKWLLVVSCKTEYTRAATITEIDMFTISLPIRTVVRKALGDFKRLAIYLKREPFLILLLRSLTLLSEKKEVSDDEKNPERNNNIIIAKSFVL